MVLVAIVGTGGLRPALAAIEAGKDLAVASKEILVMAGESVMSEAARRRRRRPAGRLASTTRSFNVLMAGFVRDGKSNGSQAHRRSARSF